jgi:cbb3-type cytochrome oxidase maturation protein
MSVIFFLIPLSILAAASFLAAFIWAVRSGQYEDTCTPSLRLLMEERQVRRPTSVGNSTPDETGRGEGRDEPRAAAPEADEAPLR